MPTYHYRCSECGHSFDQFQKFSEDALTECPQCQGLIKRVPQPVGIVFKGSGWYITDSRESKSGSGKSEKSSSKETNGASKSESSSSGSSDSGSSADKAPAAAATSSS